MSRPNPNYKGSAWDKFTRWAKGTYDPADGRLESTPPEKGPSPGERAEQLLREYDQSRFEEGVAKEIGAFQIVSRIFFVLMALFMVAVLLYTVSFLPAFGDPNSPVNNEVSQRYIEQGLEETGAVNIVAGMILDYRAFDTFGESCVLFVALCCVTILLRADKKEDIRLSAREELEDLSYEPQEDNVLQQAARLLVPLIVIFGIYVVLNGHISPGGGFSGGAIIGTGLILYLTAFGVRRTRRFMNERVIKTLTVCALTFYCFAKSYSFYTGANHLESIITTGTPGAILSAGLIVYLNICVGIVVACTMYSFYILFRRGAI
ncbi:MAG: hypothetical protein LUF68_00840 [Clostridiales bacterium]|nr:hypothetical protein [Clostridiales bacterium]